MLEIREGGALRLSFPRRLFSVLAMGYVGLILSAAIGTYWQNYSHSDGIALPNREVVGGDFLCFYVAGESARTSVDSLYDYERGHLRQQRFIGDRKVRTGYLPFAYPPLLALIFSPLSLFSLQHAYLIWLGFSATLCALAGILVLRWMRISRVAKGLFLIASFAFVPYLLNCLGGGQTSCLGLIAFALVYHWLKSKRDFLAGMALSLSYYKPPLFFVFVVFVILRRRWKMLAGFCLIATLLIAASILMVGWNGFLGYVQMVSHYTYGHEIIRGAVLPPGQGVGLYAVLMTVLKGSPGLAKLLFCFLSAMLILTTYIVGMRGRSEARETEFFDLSFALEVVLSVFLSIQLLYYDLTLLLVPLLIVGSRLWTSKLDKWGGLSLFAVVGLYTEFIYREALAHRMPIKAATVILCVWVLGLLMSLSRGVGERLDSAHSQ